MKKLNGNLFDGFDMASPSDEVLSEEEFDQLERGQYQEAQESLPEEEVQFEQAQDFLSEDEELEHDTELVTSARLRLDQGRLYEMVIAHDFFADVDANPKAIKNVQREIRNFAKERLEVLLGLKPDPKLVPISTRQTSSMSGLTEMEVDLLKKFLAKASGGVTEKVKDVPKQVKPVSNTIAKINQPAAPSNTIKSIGQPKQVQSKPVQQQVRQPQPAQKKQIVKEKVIDDRPIEKPLHLMTPQEMAERNQRAAARQASLRVGSKKAAPMPSAEQQEYMYMNQQARNPSLASIQTIVRAVQQNKKQTGE